MKDTYTQHTLNEFFEEFKKLPNSYKIEQVHELLNNPDAKARYNVRSYLKHLKLFIMISAFIVGVSAILLWTAQNETNSKEIINEKEPVHANFKDENKTPVIQISNRKSILIAEKQNGEELKSLNNGITMPIEEKAVMSIIKDTINHIKVARKSNWPLDTVINKDSLVIQLSKEELLKLGIVLKPYQLSKEKLLKLGVVLKEGTQLSRIELLKLGAVLKDDTLIILKDTITQFRGRYTLRRNTNRLILSENDVIPEYITPEINMMIFFAREMGYYSKCDTLLPLVVGNSGYVLWYNGTPAFFSRLPDRYKHLQEVIHNLKELKKKNPDRCPINYYPNVSDYNIDSIKALKLPKEFFKKMGIRIEDTIFSMQYPEHGINFTKIGSRLGKPKCRNAIYMSTQLYKKFPDLNPVFLTDEIGNIEYNFYYRGDSALNYSLLVPVYVDFKELIGCGGPDWSTKYIFWYYPSDKFIAALPPEIRDELKLERDDILNNRKTASSSCTYFEVCRSTLQLDNFKLYPNPANYIATVEFDIPMEVEGTISLLSIGGSKLKMLLPNSTFPPGHNTYKLNVSGISAGIYLISINTNKGFKTQRLVVSQ